MSAITKKEVSCGAVIWRKSPIHKEEVKEYLILKHGMGHHAFAKGHVEEFDADKIATARREIREETGLEVEIDKGFEELTEYSPAVGVSKKVYYYVATPNPPEQDVAIQEAEISFYQWLKLKEAIHQVSYQNDKKVLFAAAEYIGDKASEDPEIKKILLKY